MPKKEENRPPGFEERRLTSAPQPQIPVFPASLSIWILWITATDNPLAADSPGQYQHVTKYHFDKQNDAANLSMANLELLRFVDSGTTPGDVSGDLMDGIIVALDMMTNHCKKLKFEKRIYIMTDAANPMNTEDYEQVKGHMEETNVVPYIIHERKSQLKRNNEEFLRTFAESLNGAVFSGEEALALLSQLRTRTVRPTTLFRGPITFGDPELHADSAISVPVWVYNKTAELKIPTAKKWSSVAETAADVEDKTCAVTMSRVYKIVQKEAAADGVYSAGGDADKEKDDAADDDEDAEVDPDDLIKAYRYGKALIPFAQHDEESMKLRTAKGMSIIGFVPMEKLQRWYITSNVYAVMPEPNNKRASKIFFSLARALHERECFALVRYVRINDATPKLGAMVPVLGAHGYCVFAPLPYANDLRHYTFTPLAHLLDPLPGEEDESLSASGTGPSASASSSASSSQANGGRSRKKHKDDTRLVSSTECVDRMDDFIHSMDLMEAVEVDGQPHEAYKIRDVFNPAYQRLYQCIAVRALNPKAPLPEVDPRVVAGISPLPELMEKSKEPAERLKEAFKIEK
ncbi:X-ray repair cross-complementing protein 5, partial [Quaeritorhiza haematococci]